MDHLVHYRTGPGETKYERVGSLEEAANLVERVHGDATDVRVYKQIPIEIKTYVKVNISDGPDAPAPAPGSAATPPSGAMTFSAPTARPAAPPPAPASEGDADHDAVTDEGSRRASLFGRG